MMPLAPQPTVPLGQTSSLNMKTSKFPFSIESIVGDKPGGKRKNFDSVRLDSESMNDNEMMAKSLKRQYTSTPTSDGHLSGAASPVSAGQRSPVPAERHSVSPLSVKSLTPNGILSKTESDVSPAARGTPSPNSLAAAHAHASLAAVAALNPLTGVGVPSSFHNRSPLGLLPGHPLAGLGSLPGQIPSVGSFGAHSNHPMMMAAAAATAATSGHAGAGAPLGFPPNPMDYQQALAWFRFSNPFASRFPGNPFDAPFLLPPFRKPKRIRTAFSPGQLLKLEQAFEKNHYVVGNERKQLASHLGLSETQVKVWFQNRRTKHKRQKQEDEEGTGSSGGAENGSSGAKHYSDDEEEEIDLEDDEDELHSDQEAMMNAAEAMKIHSMAQAGLVDPNQAAAAAAAAAAFGKFDMRQLWYQQMAMQMSQQPQSQAKSPQPPTASPL